MNCAVIWLIYQLFTRRKLQWRIKYRTRTVLNRLLLAALVSLGLAACVPEDTDPARSVDAGKLGVSYTAAGLGNIAVQLQNSIVSDAAWFTQSTGSALNLAAMRLGDTLAGARVRSHICPAESGREVIQLTWLERSGGTAQTKSSGGGDGGLMAGLRERVAADQVGRVGNNGTVELVSGGGIGIPSSCGNLRIDPGTVVLAFRIARPAAPVQQLSKTEYRTVPCPRDMRGLEQRGTQVQSRVVSFSATGEIFPRDPEAGWRTDAIGTCVPDIVVTATGSTVEGAGTVALERFADRAAQGLRDVLQQQLQMDCATTAIQSDVIRNAEQGKGVREQRIKTIDTCTKATASAAGLPVGDRADTRAADRRDLCVERGTVVVKPFLGVATGTLATALSGTAWVERVVDKVMLSTNGDRRVEREKWVGKDISCVAADSYVTNCANVPGAPGGPDFGAAAKWNTRNIAHYGNNEAWYNKIINFCFIGCTYATGGGAYTLNWDYFRSKQTLHGPQSTTTATGSRLASTWLDANRYFAPRFVPRSYVVPPATNQCLIRRREIQLDCPLRYDAARQAGWSPAVLTASSGFQTTMIPGGSYGGDVGAAYNSVRNRGETPGLVWLNWKKCNIKGCDSWTDYAGPGTNAYIKSWTYGDRSSVGGQSASVQTIMMNRDGQLLDYQPTILSGPLLRYPLQGRYTTPLRCGRIEAATYAGWPVLVRYRSCNRKGRCQILSYMSSTVVTQRVVREWLGESATVGTWSLPLEYYTSSYGSWSSLGAIPNPIVIGP